VDCIWCSIFSRDARKFSCFVSSVEGFSLWTIFFASCFCLLQFSSKLCSLYVRLYCDICLVMHVDFDFACRSVVAQPYFTLFHFISFYFFVPILLCYVLFCNGVWPLFNKRLLTCYLLTYVAEHLQAFWSTSRSPLLWKDKGTDKTCSTSCPPLCFITRPLLQAPHTRTAYGSRAFSSAVPAIWNNLPTSFIEANSLPAFRRRLKTHLFTVAFENSG